jgi:transcriptional regulator with XRE-family HTH domain
MSIMITVEQIKAARALKGWSQKELGELAGLSQTAITNIEVGKFRPTPHTTEAIRKAFELHGLEFIQGGVRLRPSAVITIQGPDYEQQIMDMAFSELIRAGDHEILLSGVDFNEFDKPFWELVKSHISRLQEAGYTQRILMSPSNFARDVIGPLSWHRRLSQELFNATTPTMIFSDHYAIMLQDQQEWLIIKNSALADNQRRIFNFMWENADVLTSDRLG